MRYNVNLDKQVLLEFLLFEWWEKYWDKYSKQDNKKLWWMKKKSLSKYFEEAVVYIEQGGNVIWDWEDKYSFILNSLIPKYKKYGREDFVKLWKQYKKDFYSHPRKIKHKFEY
jgi:hypothetical protein